MWHSRSAAGAGISSRCAGQAPFSENFCSLFTESWWDPACAVPSSPCPAALLTAPRAGPLQGFTVAQAGPGLAVCCVASEKGLCASSHSSLGTLTPVAGNPWGKECGDSISGMQQVLSVQVPVLGDPPFAFALTPTSNVLFAINTSLFN